LRGGSGTLNGFYLGMKFSHLSRYKDIAQFLYRCAQAAFEHHYSDSHRPSLSGRQKKRCESESPEALVRQLEAMGPTFVKFGQILSSRSQFLPENYVKAFSRLQDHVQPLPIQDITTVIERETGSKINEIFSDFSEVPIGSGSLGQAHEAILKDGRNVVIKVQRPGIRQQIENDLDILGDVTKWVQKHTRYGKLTNFHEIFRQFKHHLSAELDLQVEAWNMRKMKDILGEFEHIYVPEPLNDYTTSKLLIMEKLEGVPLNLLDSEHKDEATNSAHRILAEEVIQAYCKQILIDGFFHADPHPGNMILLDDGRLALFDFGMTIRLDVDLQERLLQLLMAMCDCQGEKTADLLLKLGITESDFDEFLFRNRITELVVSHPSNQSGYQEAGSLFLDITNTCAHCGLRLNPDLNQVGRALLHLDSVGKVLCRQVNIRKVIKAYSTKVVQHRLLSGLNPINVFHEFLEVKDFVTKMPSRINHIFDMFTHNRFSLKIDAIDQLFLMQGLQKIANRITMGLILAALIVGAALMMRIQTDFTVFGYPGIAIICFIFAAASGMLLVMNIIISDREKPSENNKT